MTPADGGRDLGVIRDALDSMLERKPTMAVHYLEIVSDDADTLTALYQRLHSLAFGPPDPDLGQARVAMRADGTLVGIRTPLAAHERPIVRTYLAVDDIHRGRMRPRPTARRLPIPRRGRASGAPLPS